MKTSKETTAWLERIGVRIYDDLRSGVVTFDECEASFITLTDLTEGETWFGIPEIGLNVGA